MATGTGQSRAPDVALLAVAYGTALQPNEIARLTVADYLNADGSIKRETTLRREIAFNRKERPLYWTSGLPAWRSTTYLAARLVRGHGIRTRPREYRGVDGTGPLFLTADGAPFLFTKRHTFTGRIRYSCESMTAIYRLLASA